MYTLSEEIPGPDVYNGLREIVGWGRLDETAVAAHRKGSVHTGKSWPGRALRA